MKQTTKLGKSLAPARTLRLRSETVKKLSVLSCAQLRQAVGGNSIHSLDDLCYEDSVYCPA